MRIILLTVVFLAISAQSSTNEQPANRVSDVYYVEVQGESIPSCGYMREAVPCKTIANVISQILNSSGVTHVNIGPGIFDNSSANIVDKGSISFWGRGIHKTNLTDEQQHSSAIMRIQGSSILITNITFIHTINTNQALGVINIQNAGRLSINEAFFTTNNPQQGGSSSFIICSNSILTCTQTTFVNASFIRGTPAIQLVDLQQQEQIFFQQVCFQNLQVISTDLGSKDSGSALQITLSATTKSSISFTDCMFDQCGNNNTGDLNGGAIGCQLGSDSTIPLLSFIQTRFTRNTGVKGGAVYFTGSNNKILFQSCIFYSNTASGGDPKASDIFFATSTTINASNFVSSVSHSSGIQISVDGVNRSSLLQGSSSPVTLQTGGDTISDTVYKVSAGRDSQVVVNLVSGTYTETQTIVIGWYIDQGYRRVELGPSISIIGNNRLSIIRPSTAHAGGPLIHIRGGNVNMRAITLTEEDLPTTISRRITPLILAERGHVSLVQMNLKSARLSHSAVTSLVGVLDLVVSECSFESLFNTNVTLATQTSSLYSPQSGAGALYIEVGQGVSGTKHNVLIEKTSFLKCCTVRSGGALSIVTIENSGEQDEEETVSINQTTGGETEQVIQENIIGKVKIRHCSFTKCGAGEWGGAVHILGSFNGNGSSVTKSYSSFDNDADFERKKIWVNNINNKVRNYGEDELNGKGSSHIDLQFFFCEFSRNFDGKSKASDVIWRGYTVRPLAQSASGLILPEDIGSAPLDPTVSNKLTTQRIEEIFVSCKSHSGLPRSSIGREEYDQCFSSSYSTVHLYPNEALAIEGIKQIARDETGTDEGISGIDRQAKNGSPLNPYFTAQQALDEMEDYSISPTALFLHGKEYEVAKPLLISDRNIIIRGYDYDTEVAAEEAIQTEGQGKQTEQTQNEIRVIFGLRSGVITGSLVSVDGVGSISLEGLVLLHNPINSEFPLIQATEQASVSLIGCRLSPNGVTSQETPQLRPYATIESGTLSIQYCLFDPIIFSAETPAFLGSNLLSLSVIGTKFIGVNVQEGSVISAHVIKVGLQNGCPATILHCLFDSGHDNKKSRSFSTYFADVAQVGQSETYQSCSICDWQHSAVFIYGADNSNGGKGGGLTLRATNFSRCYTGALRVDSLTSIKIFPDCIFERNSNPNVKGFSNYLTNVLLTTSYRSAQGQSSCINIKKGLIAREGIEGDIITPSHLRKMVFEAEKESFLGQNWERNSNSKKNKGANYAWISYDDGVMFYGSIAEGGKYARSVNRINKGQRDDININDITNQKKIDSVNKVQISPVTSHQSPSQSNQLKQDFQFNKMKTEEEIRLEEIEKDNDDKYSIYNIPKISKIKVEYKLNADETASEVSNVTLTGDWLIGCSHAAALRIEIFEKGSDDAKLASIPTNSIQIQDKNINKDSNAALRPVKVILDSAHLAEVVDSGKVIYTIKGDEFSFDLDKKYEARIAYGLNGRKTNNVKVSFKKLK